MAPKRDLQQSLDALVAKRNGKKIADPVTKKSKEEDLARLQSVAVMKDIPESSRTTDSSSESEVEDEDEGLDIWERESRRMFPPREETNEWRTWTTQELAILEMEYMASMLDVVPITGKLDDAELGPEVQFDMQYSEEEEIVAPQQAAEQQEQNLQGIEDSESAKIPQEQTDINQIGTDAATIDAADVPPKDVAATVDASDAVADPLSSIPPANK